MNNRKKKIMTHIVAGYPNLSASEKLVEIMVHSGVSFVEIQIPFSDPVADGPILMKANEVALQNDTTPEDAFSMMQRLQKRGDTPLLFMTYYNIVFSLGVDKFCQEAANAGAYGLIIPDIPMDEEPHEHYLAACKKYNLHAIQIVTPYTSVARLKKIAKVASGFVYCVARSGTTGEETAFTAELREYLQRVKKHIDLPLALGFGIARKEQVEAAQKEADIVVIGSKIASFLKKGTADELKNVADFLREMLA